MKHLGFFALIFTLVAAEHPRAQETPQNAADWVRLAFKDVCSQGAIDALSAQEALNGAWFLAETSSPPDRPFKRTSQRFALPNGELNLVRAEVGGALRRFSVDIFEFENKVLKPVLQAQTGSDCTPRSIRRIRTPDDKTRLLDHLDSDFETVLWTEKLQVPWPEGARPEGPVIALIDSGLAYDLPLFRDRLARDKNGTPFGYDFWDLDTLPYDGDTSRNVFQPIRHGTPVASVIAHEAPNAALVPFRYPRPDMSRMGDVIKAAAKSGARILSMPLGSRNEEDWAAFEKAMRDNPDLLAIVSAGNNGRNLDIEPLWPSALNLDNMIVVTSSDAFGRLADSSNWGVESVDLMVPGENIPVTDFRGSTGRASGTSYAVPRVVALAARILGSEPELSTDELKRRIFRRAIPPRDRRPVVSQGWIVDPDRD